MKELVNEICDILVYFEKTKKKLTYEEAKKVIKINNENIKGEEQTSIFDRALRTLVENGSLFFNEKTKEYDTIKNHEDLICSELLFRRNGCAYIKVNNTHIAIDNSCLNGALEGDKVLVSDVYEKHHKLYGKVYKVLKRKNDKVIFEVVGDGLSASLIPPIGFNTFINVRLSKADRSKLLNGQYIVVSVGTEKEDGEYIGELVEIIKEQREIKPITQLIA